MVNENAIGKAVFKRVDRPKGIYFGTFQFTGLDKRTIKRITITEVRFDYKQFD